MLSRLAALFLLLFSVAASAQPYSQQQLDSIIDFYISSNGQNAITGQVLRNTLAPITQAIFQNVTTYLPQQFGAKCDGATDDTGPLQTWAASLASGVTLVIPAATCVFKSGLTFGTGTSTVIGAAVIGYGQTSILKYEGISTTANLLTFGSLSTNFEFNQGTIGNFRVTSTTKMTAGAGAMFYKYGRSSITNLFADGQDGSGNLYNGIVCAGCNEITILQSEASAQNDNLQVYSITPTGSLAGGCYCGPVYIVGGKYAPSNTGPASSPVPASGIHLAALASVTVDGADIIGNNYDILIDTAQTTACNCSANPGNQDFILGKTAFIDSAATALIYVNDGAKSAGNKVIDLAGSVASSAGVGIDIEAWNQNNSTVQHARLSISANQISNTTSDGILLKDAQTFVSISPTTSINNNGGYGVNCTVNLNVPIQAMPFFYLNTSGNYSANCPVGMRNVPSVLGQSHIPFILVSSGSMGDNGALSAVTTLPATYPSAYVYLPTGAITAASTAGWYYTVFSSATAGTVYNNTYTAGTPTIPASPTPFVVTGPVGGTFTQTTASLITAYSLNIPGNTLGTNGAIRAAQSYSYASSANAKTVKNYYSSYALFTNANSTSGDQGGSFLAGFSNRQATNVQVTAFGNAAGGLGIGATSPLIGGIDSTANQNYTVQMQLVNASDFIVNESITVELIPGVP